MNHMRVSHAQCVKVEVSGLLAAVGRSRAYYMFNCLWNFYTCYRHKTKANITDSL